MARRTVEDAGTRYTIADDDPAAPDLLAWAVLRARAIDELTQAPPHVPVTLTSDLRGSRPRVADGGVCGLVARPRDVAHALVRPNGFSARLTAPGYLPRDLGPAIERARRTLNAAAAVGASTLDVTPADPAPRAQFSPGRGVALDRPAPAVGQDFMLVATTSPPPAAGDVPIAPAVPAPLRAPGTRLAGVPLALGDQPLHRAVALRLRGRVQARTSATTIVPAVGASLGILGIWWNYPSSMTAAPLAPDVCSVRPTLRLSHPAGATVHRCTLSNVGAPRALRAGASIDARELLVAPNAALNTAGGDLIRVGDPLSGEDEVVVTAGFDPTTDPAAAVRLRLRTPTAYLHRIGEPVQVVQAAGVAAVSPVAREAQAGDAVLFAAGLTALPTTTTLIVEQGTPRAAFYRATQLPSTPDGVTFNHQIPLDPDGRFEWPPIGRLAQVRLVARLAPFAPVQLDVALDYGGETSIPIVLT
jgi:hypothetical protein